MATADVEGLTLTGTGATRISSSTSTRRTMKRHALALTAACALVLSGCGGASEEDTEAASSLSASLMEQGDSTVSVSQEEADCVSEGIVEGVGVDELKEYGVLTEDLKIDKDPGEVEMSTADAEAAADSLFDCTDVRAMVDSQMSEQMAGQPPEVQKCLDEVLTDDRLRLLYVAIFSGDQEGAQSEIVEPMTECATSALRP